MKTPPALSQNASSSNRASVPPPARKRRKRLRATNRLHSEVARYRVDDSFNLHPENPEPEDAVSDKPCCRFSLLIKGNTRENGDAVFQVLHHGEVLDWEQIEPSLLHLLKDLLCKLVRRSPEEQEQAVFLRQLRTHILAHLQNENFGVEALGRLVGYCAAQLTRKIEKYAQMHPSAFIHAVRIEEACRLLKTTSKRVNEVGFEVGYGYPSNFSSKFRELTGMTPKEYVRKYRV